MDSLQSFKLYTLFLLTNNLEKVKNCMPSECPTFNSPVLSQHESKNWQKNIEPSFTRINSNQKISIAFNVAQFKYNFEIIFRPKDYIFERF